MSFVFAGWELNLFIIRFAWQRYNIFLYCIIFTCSRHVEEHGTNQLFTKDASKITRIRGILKEIVESHERMLSL